MLARSPSRRRAARSSLKRRTTVCASASAQLEREFIALMMPRDPNDSNDVFVEIRAGTGGDEAAIFAGDLARMYMRFAEAKGMKTELVSESPSEAGGYKEIVFAVKGNEPYRFFKHESGVHRVQRVPATEAQGRIHTSTATVAVLPQVEDDVEVEIKPADLQIDTYKASGAGGQYVNKTESAIRITHVPTGIVVASQQERSQQQNREKAMQMLRATLYDRKRREQEEAVGSMRRSQVTLREIALAGGCHDRGPARAHLEPGRRSPVATGQAAGRQGHTHTYLAGHNSDLLSGRAVTPTTSPPAGVVLGPQACPAAVADPAYWLPIIKPYSYGGPQTVEGVSCASMLGTSSLQTLVMVRRADSSQTLDVYVFTNTTQPSPTLIFQLNGLVKGDAKISGYSTVLTAQADQLSTINAGKPVSTMTADLFREFKWSASAGKMVQTVFPGIFPDLTRYQAEADQASINQGHQPWKLSATQVATTLAISQLNWSPSSITPTLLSGGGVQ